MCVMKKFGLGFVILWFLAFVLIFFLMSCRTQYVPVKEVHTEYVAKTDTVHHHDSTHSEKETIIREVNKGDSALLAKYGIQLRDNERMILFLQRELESAHELILEHSHDSVAKGDSIPIPYPVTAELSAWQKVKVTYGGYAMGVVLLVAVGAVLWLRRKWPP